MTTLMPQGAYRTCPNESCGHRWYGAYSRGCNCPACDRPIGDATPWWPHVCESGHSRPNGDSPCHPCSLLASAKQAKEERRVAAVPFWEDRL